MDTGIIPVTSSEPKELGEDRARDVLGFIHRLLMAPDEAAAPLPELLTELAKAFGGAAAGLALGPGAASVKVHAEANGRSLASLPCPWEGRPELLEQAGRAATALVVPGADRTNWLWTVVETSPDSYCVLWVIGADERSWGRAEAAALPLAGQVLMRLAATSRGHATLDSPLKRARLQEGLEKAALLTSRLAHDFGNVLTGILGFSELSLSQLPVNSLPRRYVDEVWQSAQRGAHWVQKLQLFSRRRPQPQHFLPAALGAVVAKEEARVRPAWDGAVLLNVAVPAQLPGLGIDDESLREILAQLLDNAREAIAGQGVVSLSARLTELTDRDCQELLGNTAPGSHVEITIADSGCGFSPDARRRLFVEPFFSNKPRHRGLGLAVTYGILQTFRGGLRFGPDPEQGTAVRVFLPAVAAPAVQKPLSAPERTGGARVLIVDDDGLTLRFVGSVLETAGYQVHTARCLAEALEVYAAEATPFDLVLTDIIMPDGDGYALARQLHARNPAANVLFMSCRLAGLDGPQNDPWPEYDLLLKPFRPEGLLRAVRGALARRPNALPLAKGELERVRAAKIKGTVPLL